MYSPRIWFQMASVYVICPLCSRTVRVEHQRIIKSYRPILPKIEQPTIVEQGVDPQPAELVTPTELREIENNVREAIRIARKRHLINWYMTEM